MINISTVGYTTKKEQDAYIALPANVRTQLDSADWDTAHAMNTAHDNALKSINDSRNISDNSEREKELLAIRLLLDAPGCFYRTDIIAKAGINIITSGALSDTEHQCAEDPRHPGNWHYNKAGTLALEKYLQDTYPELHIRLPSVAEMKEDIVSLKGNAMNSRSMFSGEVIPTASSYFRTSGGVEGVWDDPANKVYSGSFHPASGKSVRFRHG